MRYNPHLLPKIRSKKIMAEFGTMPCTLRIASFIPGHRCAGQNTVVGCHTGSLGKGMSTKTSDAECVAGCMHCHALLDGADPRFFDLLETNPLPLMKRIIDAGHETRALLIQRGLIVIPDGVEI